MDHSVFWSRDIILKARLVDMQGVWMLTPQRRIYLKQQNVFKIIDAPLLFTSMLKYMNKIKNAWLYFLQNNITIDNNNVIITTCIWYIVLSNRITACIYVQCRKAIALPDLIKIRIYMECSYLTTCHWGEWLNWINQRTRGIQQTEKVGTNLYYMIDVKL